MNCLIYLLRWQTNSFLFVLSAICYLFYIDITYRGQPEHFVLKPFFTIYTYNLYFTIYPLWQLCCFRAAISCLRVYTSCLLSEVSSSSARFDIEQRLNRVAIMWTLQVEYRTVRIDPNTTAFEVFFTLHNNSQYVYGTTDFQPPGSLRSLGPTESSSNRPEPLCNRAGGQNRRKARIITTIIISSVRSK